MVLSRILSGSRLESVEKTMRQRPIRKGTHSCAECKRRKTRCFFDTPNAATCVGCLRRGLSCIRQEFIDVPTIEPPSADKTRLDRIEGMVGAIFHRVLQDQASSWHNLDQDNGQDRDQSRSQYDLSPEEDNGASDRRYPSPGTESLYSSQEDLGKGSSVVISTKQQLSRLVSRQQVASWSADTSIGDTTLQPLMTKMSQALHAVLPTPQDASTLFSSARSAAYVQILCMPHDEVFQKNLDPPAEKLAILPPATSHPVVLARKLLQLALCIQRLDPLFNQSDLRLGMPPQDAMQLYFQCASALVTSRDGLLNSLEGLECLIYEGAYLINCGSLRRSLVSLRRAVTLAQFMGLHRKTAKPRVFKKWDESTRVSIDFAWGHIVYLERYLSLLLGLPTSIIHARVSERPAETEAQRFERLQIEHFATIGQRNEDGDYENLNTTQKIDHELHQLANSMPAQWWSTLEVRQGATDKDVISAVASAQMQIIHFNLLNILHLPFILRNRPHDHYEYSHRTCLYASREVLSRYIVFRSIVKRVYCCRPVDFCAFTAAMTLLLAHINDHSQQSGHGLAHQRLADRALIEKALETLDKLHQINGDELTLETAKLARRLLDAEASCARGVNRYESAVVGKRTEHDDLVSQDQALHIRIPHFGTVKIAHQVSVWQLTSGGIPESLSTPSIHDDLWPKPTLSSLPSSDSRQPISSAFYPQKIQPASNSMDDPGLYSLPAMQGVTRGYELPSWLSCHPWGAVPDGFHDDFDVAMPDFIAADLDEWVLQGVDTMLFESLVNGAIGNNDNNYW